MLERMESSIKGHMFIYISATAKQPTCPVYIWAQETLITLETNMNRKPLSCYLQNFLHRVPKFKWLCVWVCGYVRACACACGWEQCFIPRLCKALQRASTPHQGNAFHSEKPHLWTLCGPHQLLSTGCRKHQQRVDEKLCDSDSNYVGPW